VPELTVGRYHQATKHLPGRPSSTPYGLEWWNEPDPFKRYPGIEGESPPEELSRLLRLGAGVHPRRGDPHYRTFMSAGALHPVELYVATRSGLWHYHPGEGALRRLRGEDPRAALAAAAAAPEISSAAIVLILTGILWRTAWKYGARGWRHIFWDAGAMLANLLALSADADPRLLTAFVDAEVAAALGVEPPREAPVALLAARHGQAASPPTRLEPIHPESPPLSQRERRFREAEEAQLASSLARPEEVRAWRERAQRIAGAPSGGGEGPAALDEAILRRGSAREFTHDPVGSGEIESVLAWACSLVPGDLPPVCSTYVVAHAVEHLEGAIYRFERPDRFRPVRRGAERRRTAHVCLGQSPGGDAAATVFFTADLQGILATLGEHGYRAAQLDAGIRGGRASLGAYARGLGATGLTFYDDEVRRYLGTGEEPMMCVAMGVDARRPGLRRTARAA
jgi:SagB-type dehydrogenase family enzyme